MKAGIFDTNAADYYADRIGKEPTLNATVAKLLLSASPRHAWQQHPRLNPSYEPTVDKKFDVGTAAHEIMLLGNDRLVHVVNASDWRTKAAQEVRDRARAEGMVPLLAHEWVRVSAMLAAIREQLPQLDLDGPGMFVDGKAEMTLVWKDRGVWCRARMDYLHDDFSACDDLKSTARSANPYVWTRSTLWNIGADIQYAMTLRGIHAITGSRAAFRFLVCETHAPFGMCVVSLDPMALELANRKVDRALDLWRDCLEGDFWPSYSQQICWAEPPRWVESDLLEDEEEVAAA